MATRSERLPELKKGAASYHRASSVVATAFTQLHETALADGALNRRVKELMAVAVAVVTHCDGCVHWHLQAAADAGATREMAIETLDVAVLMGGGPSMLTAGETMELVDEVFPT